MTLTMRLAYFVLLPVILLSQATWIFIDARRRGEHYYWLWGMLGLLNFPTSLIVYLLVMGYHGRRRPLCGQQMPNGQLCCKYCRNVCPQCHSAVRLFRRKEEIRPQGRGLAGAANWLASYLSTTTATGLLTMSISQVRSGYERWQELPVALLKIVGVPVDISIP